MKIYLAARYSRRRELCLYRDQLVMLGHEVTARWLDGPRRILKNAPLGEDGERLAEDLSIESSDAAELRRRLAAGDVADIESCDMLIAFTEPPSAGNSRGGRHVEFGIALALMKKLVVIGPRENVFHWINAHCFDTFAEFLKTCLISENKPTRKSQRARIG